MTENKEIIPPSGLVVKVSKHGSPRIVQLLKNTVFGTEGKLRYRQQEITERIKSQANVQFIEILKGKRILGTVGMAHRGVQHGNNSMRSLYVRYLSIAHPFKSRKRRSFQGSALPKPKKGALHSSIANEITSHFEQPFIENDRKGAFYAYVESANINSRNLCISMGFTPTRKVETLLFSRFNPKQKRSIQNLAEHEQDDVKKQLKGFYEDYSFYFEDKIFQTGFYLVKKENHNIIGGIRAIPVTWQLVDYPGFEGWLMQDVLPFLPYTNRLFQPNAFKFLAFDYAWHIPNHEHILPELMSHCSSLFGIHLGMIWGDSQSGLIKNLKSSNELGFMHSVVGAVYADLMIRPINFQKNEPEIETDTKLEEDKLEDELAFPPKEVSSEKGDSNTSIAQEKVEVESDKAANTVNSKQIDATKSETENAESIQDENLESDNESKTSVKKDKLDGMREILNLPVFVSALDMT